MTNSNVATFRIGKANDSEALKELKRNLVYGYRILARYGIGVGLLGHLTARLPGANTFWSYQWGDSFEKVTESGLRECDFDCNVITGDGEVNDSLKIEGILYAARPDILCISHHHSDNCLALGSIGEVLQPFERSACRAYDDMALLEDFDNAHRDPVAAKAFVAALGTKNSVMMQHHGVMICGTSIQDVVVRTKEIEISAGVQLKAMAAGKLKLMNHEEAVRARDFKRLPKSYMGVWDYEVAQVNIENPHLFSDARTA
jgi:L-fuculose-phosphate aldolase